MTKEEILETKNWNSEYPNYMAENEILKTMNTDINKIEDKDGNKFINTPIGLFGVPEFNDEDFSFEDFWRDDNDLKIYEPPKLIENKNANTELPK